MSKSAQSLSSAPASIYVITREEILRSGVLSIPEALRLAPNLQVDADQFAGLPDRRARLRRHTSSSQNFSNKILILIDGRSVYNPLFSGVAYDAQDVFMDDVDRIEVISGPGATLWGANAMNGVINIITRSAQRNAGRAAARHAAATRRTRSPHATAATSATTARSASTPRASIAGRSELAGRRERRRSLAQGAGRDSASDFGARRRQSRSPCRATTSTPRENAGAFGDVDFSQFDLLGRWEHAGERANTRLQVYFDRTDRDQPPAGVGFDAQHLRLRIPADR